MHAQSVTCNVLVMGRGQLLTSSEQAQFNVMQHLRPSLYDIPSFVRRIKTACRNYLNGLLHYGKQSKYHKRKTEKSHRSRRTVHSSRVAKFPEKPQKSTRRVRSQCLQVDHSECHQEKRNHRPS
uniref:Uncharacterized protein n=1 Tax=Caenorhabditis japonica TaxID=281687 RepID=A0A8R1IKC2_CAEJA